jgi:hypothetical protein
LKSTPGLRPVVIFDEIRRRHPEIGAGVRRTLERRIRAWRALNGAERDVIFGIVYRRMADEQSCQGRVLPGRSIAAYQTRIDAKTRQ